MSKKCPDGKILNPKSNRCVKIDGKIGKQLIKTDKSKPIEIPKDIPSLIPQNKTKIKMPEIYIPDPAWDIIKEYMIDPRTDKDYTIEVFMSWDTFKDFFGDSISQRMYRKIYKNAGGDEGDYSITWYPNKTKNGKITIDVPEFGINRITPSYEDQMFLNNYLDDYFESYEEEPIKSWYL